MTNYEEQIPISIGVISKDSLKRYEDGWATSNTLRFDPEILAQDKWQEMLVSTQEDGLERFVDVYSAKRQLEVGPIKTTEKGKDKDSNDFTHLDISPRRILSRIFRHEILQVHAHPKPQELDHIPTTPLSDKDINKFLSSSQKAFVMIDPGGVHILARIPFDSYALDDETEKPPKTVKTSFSEVIKTTGLVMDVIKETAKKLKPKGIRYYYSPNLGVDTDGLIKVTDVLKTV
jgi:hypothetical protein